MGREPFSSWSTWKRGATIKERRRTEESLSVVPIGVLPEEFRQRRYIPENRTQAKVKGSENSHEGAGAVLSGAPGASSHPVVHLRVLVAGNLRRSDFPAVVYTREKRSAQGPRGSAGVSSRPELQRR